MIGAADAATGPPLDDLFVSGAILLGLATAGVVGWRRLAPRLAPLPPGATSADGWAITLAGFLGTNLLGAVALSALGFRAGDEVPLEQLMTARAGVSLLVVALVFLWIGRRHGSLSPIGLSPSAGPPLPVAGLGALSAWLAFYPALVVVALLNAWLLARLGVPDGMQDYLRRFLEEPAARHSIAGWLAMVLVLPFCEEVFFRAGLFGALRTRLPPPVAIVLSGAAFGMLHDGPAMLPAAALGCALAWLYERSGSLALPVAFHVLHNGLTLAMLSSFPELAGPASG